MAQHTSDQTLEGVSVEELFVRGLGITYDDFYLLNTIYSDIVDNDFNFEMDIGNGVVLKLPIVAAPMDTVTNAEACIGMALMGALGCIHNNYLNIDGTPDLDTQEREIRAVKGFENGFIEQPIVASPNYTIAQAIELGERDRPKGSRIKNFPVTYGGRSHGRLLGLLRDDDYSTELHTDMKVKERMVPLEKLITAEWPITLDEANERLWEGHIRTLPIVDKRGRLKYLVTRSDLDKNDEFPMATKDSKKRLRVLFAIGTHPKVDYERLERGFGAGADGCIIDTTQGFTGFEKRMTEYILKKYPGKLVIGGNISTAAAYRDLNSWNLHAARIGQGPGSICTTSGAIGTSRAAASGVYWCSRERKKVGGVMVPWADGGIHVVAGDLMKAYACGADVVMLGSLLAGTDEGPGEVEPHPDTNLPVKVYRGMGSAEANKNKIRGYSKLPQGKSGYVEYRGSLYEWLPLMLDGLISAFKAHNIRSIPELHEAVYAGDIRFENTTPGSRREMGVHDLM